MNIHAFTLFSVLGLGAVLLTGCGGGGGGGGGSTSKSVNYTGPTTPAIITDTNANTLTGGAINGGKAMSVAVGAAVNAEPQGGLSVPKLAEILTGLAGIAKPEAPLVAGAAFSDTASGACGGTASLTGTDNSIPGHFDILGTMTFSGYCSPAADNTQVVLNGAVNFTMSGTSSSDFVFTMNSPYLSATVGGQAYTYSLSYSCTITGGVAGTVTLTANLQEPDGKVYRIENYQVNVNTSYHTLSIQGRFYDPDYGYVDVSTPVVLTYTDCTNRYLPASGTLQVTGANGDHAEFNAINDCIHYQVCITFITPPSNTCTTYSW